MKKIILTLVFIVYTLIGYSGSIYLLGQTNHSGISVEIWRYDGTLVDTSTTNSFGFFTFRYSETTTHYKLIAKKSGYLSVVVDSVHTSNTYWHSAEGPLRTIDFFYLKEPVMTPTSGVVVLKNYLNEDLSDTSVFYLVENNCRIAKDIKVSPGVKLCFAPDASFYIENKFKLLFDGTSTDSIKFLSYPLYSVNGEGKVKLSGNSSVEFLYCRFNKFFNVQLMSEEARASFKNNKIQGIDIFCDGKSELSNNQIGNLNINQSRDYGYDFITPDIKIENNRIESLSSRLIKGATLITGNNISGYINIDTVLYRLRVEDNILNDCVFGFIDGVDFTCNRVHGSFNLFSTSRISDMLNDVFISDNAFVAKEGSFNGDIIIQNGLAGIEIKNNFFSLKRGRLKIRPGDYQWSATRDALFESNTVIGDVVFLNDKSNISRNIAVFRNVFGGDVMTGELFLEHNNNLYKGDVLCFCNASAEFSNTLGYKTDSYNNIYSESISFINDTLPFLKESVEGIERRLGVKLENYCLSGYYKSAMEISDDHSISGKILSESPFFTLAYVAAINKKNGKTSIQKTNDDGTYSFKGLKRGEYLLYAIPRDTGFISNDKYVTTTFHNDYLPTYFLNKQDYKIANKLILTGDITEANISLIKRTQSTNTNDVVAGTILYKDTTISDAGTDWMVDNPFFTPDIKHYACLNLILYAVDEIGTIVDWAKTNGRGGFIFENLPAGKFKIKAQRFGFHIENEEIFIAEPGMTDIVRYLVKDDVNPTTSVFPVTNESMNNITPNPFQDRFILKGIAYDSEVNVYDIMGKLVLNQVIYGEEALIIDGSSWPTGIYFVAAGDKLNKIIKE
jgi:hypothetical protein